MAIYYFAPCLWRSSLLRRRLDINRYGLSVVFSIFFSWNWSYFCSKYVSVRLFLGLQGDLMCPNIEVFALRDGTSIKVLLTRIKPE